MKQSDFLVLMGKGKRCWKHVASNKDVDLLKEFASLFEKNYHVASKDDPLLIPEIFHFVWLGPKEYPETSKKYLKGWLEKHPDWRFIFWSDRDHHFLPREFEKKMVTNELLGEFQSLYDKSDNFGERSDLVRLLVLDKFGGVYIDHDSECRASFSILNRSYPFYGGLLTPGNPVIQSSTIIRNSIIAAQKGEPILKEALKKSALIWDKIQREYPGNDIQSIKKRVTLRSFISFHQAVMDQISSGNFKGIIFPAGYFNEIEKEFGIMVKEDMSGSWYSDEMNHHEEYLKNRLHKMMKRMHLLFGILMGCVVLLFILLLVVWIELL